MHDKTHFPLHPFNSTRCLHTCTLHKSSLKWDLKKDYFKECFLIHLKMVIDDRNICLARQVGSLAMENILLLRGNFTIQQELKKIGKEISILKLLTLTDFNLSILCQDSEIQMNGMFCWTTGERVFILFCNHTWIFLLGKNV